MRRVIARRPATPAMAYARGIRRMLRTCAPRLLTATRHGLALEPARFIDDAFEEPAERRLRQWSLVALKDIPHYFFFPCRRVRIEAELLFDLPNFVGKARPLVEKGDELAVDIIDSDSPFVDARHEITSQDVSDVPLC